MGTVKKLLLNNDFPKFQSIKAKEEIADNFIGEVIERTVEIEPKTPEPVVNKKLKNKVSKLMKSLRTMQDIKEFIQSETNQRKNSRKDAITKKLEQAEWKNLKSNVKSKLKSEKSVSEVKQLISLQIL